MMGAVPLDRRLVQCLHHERWTALRPLQALTCAAWRSRTGSLLVIGGTASGKTDAAWLPVLDDLAVRRLASAVGISATAAGVRATAERLLRFGVAVGVTIWELHHDQVTGRQALPDAVERGEPIILLATIDLLEMMVRCRPGVLARMRVGVVVIDDAQFLLADARSAHLRAVIARMDASGADHGRAPRLRRIALALTVGNPQAEAALVDPGHDVAIVGVPGLIRRCDLVIRGYARTDPSPLRETDSETERLHQEIAVLSQGSTSLVMCATRSSAERVAAGISRACLALGGGTDVAVSHGGMEPSFRGASAQALTSGRPFCCVTTSTLDPAIDVGDVRRMMIIATPPSVASVISRCARMARRGGVPYIVMCLRGLVQRPQESARTLTPEESVNVNAVRTLAIIDLFKRGWCEPLDGCHWRLSTLGRHALSILSAQRERPCGNERSQTFSRSQLADILRDPGMRGAAPVAAVDGLLSHLIDRALLVHDDAGIRLTEAGSSLVRDLPLAHGGGMRNVQCGTAVIGEVANTDHLLSMRGIFMDGRSWKIVGSDVDGVICVEPWTEAGHAPRSESLVGGDAEVVSATRGMLEHLPDAIHAACDPAALQLLHYARSEYARLGLRYDPLQRVPGGTYAWHWLGARAAQALAIACTGAGHDVRRGYAGFFVARLEPRDFRTMLQRLAGRLDDSIRKRVNGSMIGLLPFDRSGLVPEAWAVRQYLACDVDIPAAERWLESFLKR